MTTANRVSSCFLRAPVRLMVSCVGGLLCLSVFSCGAPVSEPLQPENTVPPSQTSGTGKAPEEELNTVETSPSPSPEAPVSQPSVSQPSGAEASPSTAAEETGPESAVTNRLPIASIDDPQAVKEFVAQIRAAGVAGDRNTIVNLVHYPFTTYAAGEPLNTYRTPDELLADFDQVVTAPVITAMANADYGSLFVNYQGAMIGDGEVWFSQFDDGIKIKAINGF
ncbi:MAG: hypothetical protein WBC73_19770 [Phormidesmis sp.]